MKDRGLPESQWPDIPTAHVGSDPGCSVCMERRNYWKNRGKGNKTVQK